MITASQKLRYLSLFNKYPLVDSRAMPNLKMEKAKMVLVACAMENTVGCNGQDCLMRMCAIRGFSIDAMPSLPMACQTAGVSMDFLMDYGKLQYLFERNPVMAELPKYLYSF